MRKVSERVEGFDRFVDVGVVLRVIRVDDNGPIELESGRRASVVHEHRWGGIVDTKATTPTIVGPSRDPRVWLASEAQAPIVMHADSVPLGQLVIGSEGGGKTTALAMWHHRRWIENLGEHREGGQTAPTLARLGLVKHEFLKLWRSSWCRYVARDDFEGFELCDGSRIRFRHTQRTSAAAGSPIQGFNWSWAGRDEFQDQIDVHADIESRGRAARGGRYKQLATATAKDDPEFRTVRDQVLAGGQWGLARLLVADSPFVAAGFLDTKRRSGLTDREFRRRYLAEDVAPESRLYHTWDRRENLRPLPVGAKRITGYVLSKKTGNPRHAALAGHDPGQAKAATVFLDAYTLPGSGSQVFWWVRGEIFTLHETIEQHAVRVLEWSRARGINVRPDAEILHVRAQPVGASEDKPDQDMLRIWKRIGLDVRPAQYKKNDSVGVGQIKKESRIGMLCGLFCDAMGRRRLFVECDDRGTPTAPLLVAALESMERDEKGRAEYEEKDVRHDKSDLPAALGYGLWPWEKEMALGLRDDIQKGLG
jgi:hypothetical protein